MNSLKQKSNGATPSSILSNGFTPGDANTSFSSSSSSKYNRVSRSNSRNLFDPPSSSHYNESSNGLYSPPTTGMDGDEISSKFSSYSKKISETLARHGALQQQQESTDNNDSSSKYRWR